MDRRVVITGMGIISAIGNNREEVLESLKMGRSGISSLKYVEGVEIDFPSGEVKLSDEDMCQKLDIPSDSIINRSALMGIISLKEALLQAGLTHKEIRTATLISGTTVGGMEKCEKFYHSIVTKGEYNKYLSTHECGSTTELIADYFNGFSNVTTLSTACSSAANAIIRGAEMIKAKECDIVAAGGTECLSAFHINGFNSLRILDTEHCRPFDKTRAGLNLGEGAAFIILESYSSAKRRGAKIIAELKGYGNKCDAHHQTASSPDGKGAYMAMEEAIKTAGLDMCDISYINAHGTGTPNNDMSESTAVKRLFGENIPNISSTKSFTGHTTSASGSIESVISLLAMQNNFIPININWANEDCDTITPQMELDKEFQLNHIICNSFGFGGNDSSIVYSKFGE